MITPYELLEHHWDTLCQLCPTAEDFCQAWQQYLVGTGWTEESFLNEMIERQTEQGQ
jgi:hypothetical protein